MTGWREALDDFERRLEQCRAVLDEDAEPAPGTWPPADLTQEPIPAELVDRAQALLYASLELEEQLLARRASLPEPRSAVRHRRPAAFSSLSTEL